MDAVHGEVGAGLPVVKFTPVVGLKGENWQVEMCLNKSVKVHDGVEGIGLAMQRECPCKVTVVIK